MEFTIKKSELERNLQLLQGVIETKITMPILANILMQAEDGVVRFKATDLDVGIENTLPCDVRSPGATTLNVRKLHEIVKTFPEGDIHFERESDVGVVLTSPVIRREYDLLELPAGEFPRLPSFPSEGGFRLKGPLFCQLLEKIAFNLDPDEQKQHRGSLFVLTPDSIMLVATDGHRMSFVRKAGESIEFPVDLPEYRLILNRKSIQAILRFQPGEEVEMAVGENHVFFRIGTSVLSARLQELKFPRYEKVVPKDNDKILKINVNSLLYSLKSLCLVTSDRARPTQLLLTKEGVEIRAISPETGKAKEFLQAEYTGDDLDIRFNAQYLIDFLQVVESEEIRMELKDAERAVILKPVGEQPYEYLYVLMPIRP